MSDHNELPLPKRSIRTTIELPLFLNMLATFLTVSAVSNILLYRTCVHTLNHAVDECKFFLSPVKTNETSDLEAEVQKYTTYITTVKIILEYICPTILSLFLGGWSDTYGRKPLLVWPFFGMSMTGILLVIYGMMDGLGPWWFLSTAIPFSLTGGFVVLYTGAYCYVNDTSSSSTTAIRMMILDGTMALGTFFGSMFSSYLIEAIGNVYVLLISATINVIAYAFTNIWIVESLTGAIQNGATKIFDLQYMKEMFTECFKERPNYGRTQIILIATVRLLVMIVTIGTMNLEYFYSRKKLHWTLRDYTTFSAIGTVIAFVGGFFGIMICQRICRLGDIPFSIIAILSAILDNIIKLFAVQSWQMYLSTIASPLKGLTGPLMRSYVTKFLPTEDIAKVFALLCAVESLAPIIGPVIFNSLYSSTLSVFPGAIYILSTAMNIVSVIMLILVQYYSWNRLSGYESINN
ncbi:probable peptidoglycan muropeptide transporter SLC46 [Danaus plexippus]|uniref:probable peptidoglycan muropeptide transporter SLC46 n=1 Tax=Danaus plexippus TaxID=13037 RepID=UPI002AAF666A|nr:probable peptidoglycan muropeptide transporter SLC46 [Danaus plexippus]